MIRVAITGRCSTNILWGILLPLTLFYKNKKYATASTDIPNGIIRVDQTKKNLVQYSSGAMFILDHSTFLHAIKQGQLSTWHGLIGNLISTHLPEIW